MCCSCPDLPVNQRLPVACSAREITARQVASRSTRGFGRTFADHVPREISAESHQNGTQSLAIEVWVGTHHQAVEHGAIVESVPRHPNKVHSEPVHSEDLPGPGGERLESGAGGFHPGTRPSPARRPWRRIPAGAHRVVKPDAPRRIVLRVHLRSAPGERRVLARGEDLRLTLQD